MANNPAEANSIKGLIQGLIPDPGGVVQGIVKSVSPLSVQVEGDEKLLLNATTLILPKHLTNYMVQVTIPDVVTGATMSVNNALSVGEKVYLLSFNKGKQYYILERVV